MNELSGYQKFIADVANTIKPNTFSNISEVAGGIQEFFKRFYEKPPEKKPKIVVKDKKIAESSTPTQSDEEV